MMGEGENDFLSRWSRRKRSGEDVDTPTEDAPAADAEVEFNCESEPDADADSRLLQELGLQEPELVSPGEELAAFLRASIPAHLKRRALRHLWGSNPVLANLDGLNDYDGDFTGNTVPRGELKTIYRVGKGMIRDLVAAEDDEPPTPQTEDPAMTVASGPSNDDPLPEPEAASNPEEPAPDQGESPATRRMVFRFDRD